MKTIYVVLALLMCASAQQTQFGHIVILVQENRSPDNLFGGASIPGADVIQIGGPVALGTTGDISHSHASFKKEAAGTWPALAKNYVQPSDVQPYYDLALRYGFANRMFQTNQGPSQPAHDMLFSGTSAPSYPGELHSDWFASENASQCIGLFQQKYLDPLGVEHYGTNCKDHDTMGDRLTAANISWKYYTPSVGNIWTALSGIRHICMPLNGGCSGQMFKDHAVINPSAVLTDIQNGTLAQVSWVIPAGVNSDHPSYGSGGPAWVSSIVNAIGQSPYWQDTAIIVVWDDWGGWYDHVAPLVNQTGWCLQNCYGFRVPMLFISAYTSPNYVSNVPMDFGSILKFVEQNFNLPCIGNCTYADSFSQWDSGFYFFNLPPWRAPAKFQPIRARKLTKAELESKSDPDDE